MSDEQVINCPCCGEEVKLRKNKNGKPTFYCKACKFNGTSSGGKSQELIRSKARASNAGGEKKQEVKQEVAHGLGVGEQGQSTGGKERGFLERLWNGGFNE